MRKQSTNSFRRKLKHLLKDSQRGEDIGEAFKNLIATHRMFCGYVTNIPSRDSLNPYQEHLRPWIAIRLILSLHPDKSKRFIKLMRRLGNAARKQDSYVNFYDVIRCVRGFLDDSDARKIQFYKPFKKVTVEKIMVKLNEIDYLIPVSDDFKSISYK